MIPVILSGGVGSRLWPLSRGLYPKQMLRLVDDKWSMLQQTVQRAERLVGVKPPIIVCNEEHRFMVGEQLHDISCEGATILLEPEGRNTAPAIALAALFALRSDQNAILLVMPADHVIGNFAAYQEAIDNAQILAEMGCLVTFGIVPDKPETGYGYIKAGQSIANGFKVTEFKEKPTAVTAAKYVADGGYYWNGGIFMLQAATYLAELQHYAPDVYAAAVKAMSATSSDLDFLRVDAGAFSKSPSISIDYAVMEKTDKATVVPLDAKWSDVGSWAELWEIADKDANGNAVSGDVVLKNTRNSHIYSENRLIATLGVEDLVVVETADAVLVAGREHAQHVKDLVEQLNKHQRPHVDHHRKVYRPWGWYDSVDSGERFQVKRIMVKPQAKLSVQMHEHRAEHWVVVKGVAEVLNGEQTIVLNENESTFIPIGTKHSLKNLSKIDDLEIIEVQSGSYLGEDDIIRFEDQYGRAN